MSAGTTHGAKREHRVSQAGVQQLRLARDASPLAIDVSLLTNDASLLTNDASLFPENAACFSEHEANSDDQAIESTDEALTGLGDDAIIFRCDVGGTCRACAFRMSIAASQRHAMTDEGDAIPAALQVAEYIFDEDAIQRKVSISPQSISQLGDDMTNLARYAAELNIDARGTKQ